LMISQGSDEHLPSYLEMCSGVRCPKKARDPSVR
jgi:hypothetical protein